MLRRIVLFGLLLSLTNVAHSAEGYPEIRIGYQRSTFQTSDLNEPASQISLAGSTSGTLHSYSLQVDFNRWVGVFYRHSQGSGTPVSIYERIPPGAGAYVFSSGALSVSGGDFGLEGRYPIYGWLDSFVRFNSAQYSIDGTESDVFGQGLHASHSVSEAYLSAGVRLKVSKHFGLEAEFSNAGDDFKPGATLGLYLQF